MSYCKIEEKFGCTHKQAQAALVALKRLGVIGRVFRTIYTEGGLKLGNVMFIDIDSGKSTLLQNVGHFILSE